MSLSISLLPYSGNSHAVAAQAIRILTGQPVDTESADRAIRLYGAKDVTPDEINAAAKRLAESKLAETLKKALKSTDPTSAYRIAAAEAEREATAAANAKLTAQPLRQIREDSIVLQTVARFLKNLLGIHPPENPPPPPAPRPAATRPESHASQHNKPESIPSVPPAPLPIPQNRYSNDEWQLLQSLPWNNLPDDLKIKTIHYHDDPACRERSPDDPVFPGASHPTSTSYRPRSGPAPDNESPCDPRIWTLYDPEELRQLVCTPWINLPISLKRRTVRWGHDPFSSILNSKITPAYMNPIPPARGGQESVSLAKPVQPSSAPVASDLADKATTQPFSPNPPCLRAGRADMLRALNLIWTVGQPRKTDQIILSYDGAYLHFDLCGMSTSVQAQGEWDCQIRAKPAFLLPLIHVPLQDEAWLIWAKDNRLHFGRSFSCPCFIQDPWQASIQLPLDNDDDMLLALGLKYSAQEIERSGLKHSVAKVEDLYASKVQAAAQSLARYGVKAEDIRAFVNKRLQAKGILDKI